MSIANLLEAWRIPTGVIREVGALVLLALLLYIIGAALFAILRRLNPPPTSLKPDQMPILRPIPIPTKNRRFFTRILVWVYEVRKWELAQNWQYNLDGTTIILPKGFVFDGASIPRPLWSILSPVGLMLVPGLIHDYGYRHEQLWKIDNEGTVSSHRLHKKKSFWDFLFLRVGTQVNGTRVINFFAFLAIYLGGWIAWRKNRKIGEPATKPRLSLPTTHAVSSNETH